MTPLRELTPDGIRAFATALDDHRSGATTGFAHFRDDPVLTRVISDGPVVGIRPFASRREAAAYFYDLLQPYGRQLGDIERNAGLWSWLALAWIDILAPADGEGRRNIGAHPRWIADVEDYKRYYRHLLAGPYRIYRAHKDDPDVAMAVLATPVESPGEIVEQFASRQEFIVNRNLLRTITRLYYDPTTQALRRGASSKGAGGARRLADLLNQLDLTWDIQGMAPDDMIRLLPTEFERFRRNR